MTKGLTGTDLGQNRSDWYVCVFTLESTYNVLTFEGYIAGDAFHALHEAHPDYDYTLLVRSKEREEPVRKKYPNAANVKVVYPGDTGPALSLTDVLEEEAKRADIVLRRWSFLFLCILQDSVPC